MARFTTVLALALSLLLAAGVAAAPPAVEGVAPLAGQRGMEFTLTLAGGRLTDAQSVLFYQPGLTCTKLTATSETELVATVRAAADCPLGEHAFRVVTKGGASELRTVGVTPFPVVSEADAANDSPKSAQKLNLNSTVVGRIDAGDVDCYAVTLSKGQRLSAEVEAVRLGSPLDAVLTITGPDGKVLAEVDDAPPFRQDPVASVVAPTAGVYVVAVRDTAYGGGDAERYALHVGTFPRPAAIFPAGGQIGVETKVKLFGPAGDREQLVTPKGANFLFFPSDADGTAPTPHPFRASPFPNVLEGDAKPAAWPVAFNGILEKPGEIDAFKLTAKAGDRLDVTAFAFRIGSPLDTVVTVLDADGREVAANDDDETHDSRVRFTAPRDGVYAVRVADKRKDGGPQFAYRVEVTKPAAGLGLFLATPGRKAQDRGTITVPRGNRVAAFLAVRRDGVTGPVTIHPGDLPPGVTLAGPVVVPADEYLVPVVVEASATAEPGGKLVELTGRAGDVAGGFAQTVTLVAGPGDLSLHDVSVSKLAVAVVEDAPLRVTLDPPAAALAADGSLDVTVRLQRSDFDDAVEVSFPFLPPGVEAPASVVVPAGKAEATVTLVAKRKASRGEWPVFVEAKPAPVAATRERRDPDAPRPAGRRSRKTAAAMPPVASQIVTVRVTEPPAVGMIAAAVGEQGKTISVTLAFTGGSPPAGFTATLAGLPPRAAAKPVVVSADAKQIEFQVSIDPTTPPGDHPSLVCELAGTVEKQAVVYRVGRPGTLTVYPPGGVAVDKDGKPLSRLDALRQERATKPIK
jgi:hypothetical protein